LGLPRTSSRDFLDFQDFQDFHLSEDFNSLELISRPGGGFKYGST